MERGDSLGHLGHLAAITPNLDKIVKEDAVIHRFSIEIMVGVHLRNFGLLPFGI